MVTRNQRFILTSMNPSRTWRVKGISTRNVIFYQLFCSRKFYGATFPHVRSLFESHRTRQIRFTLNAEPYSSTKSRFIWGALKEHPSFRHLPLNIKNACPMRIIFHLGHFTLKLTKADTQNSCRLFTVALSMG